MADVLPTLMAIAVGLCLSFVLLALWQSLRGLLAHVQEGPALTPAASASRAALLHEKDELLAAIRELRFEHELGKVSAADFARLEQRYRARAREVLQELDEQIAPHRARAAQLLDQALAGGTTVTGATASVPEPVPEPTQSSPACVQCGSSNDADATFCKKCGRRLRDEVPA
jgi:hypothetical protein